MPLSEDEFEQWFNLLPEFTMSYEEAHALDEQRARLAKLIEYIEERWNS